MKFQKNSTPQIIEENNQISAMAITLYLQDHTFMSWQKMMDIWLNGYNSNQYNIKITPYPRLNGGSLYPGIGLIGGHGSPQNYVSTIQYLVDHGFVTFSHINGFKCLASTKKTKHILKFSGINFPFKYKVRKIEGPQYGLVFTN
jgi:hypothetical protein